VPAEPLSFGDLPAVVASALQVAQRDADARSGSPSKSRIDAGSRANATLVIVDALLGIGINGAPRDAMATVIEWANASPFYAVALDAPSGLDCDSGAAAGAVIQADLTVTFIATKLGLLTGQGPRCCGELVLEALGVDVDRLAGAPEGCAVLDAPVAPLPPRGQSAYKNQFGHVAVLGGDEGGGGAAMLAAEAALRSGAGLVSVGTRAAHVAPLLSRRPELMARPVAGKLDAQALLERASVVVIGPGMGQTAWGEQLLTAALAWGRQRVGLAPKRGGLVVDADGLNLLALDTPLPTDSAITPHPGEAARLLGVTARAVEQDRVGAVTELAGRYKCIAVLKGAGSLIADAQGLHGVCTLGNPGMATAGMGDTLAGLVGALVAQLGMSVAVVAYAVQVHAAAGDAARERCGEPGLLASDVIAQLPGILNQTGETHA